MKTKFYKLLDRIQNQPLIVFVSLLDLLFSLIEKTYEIFKGKIELNQIKMEYSYFEISIRILTVIFLYFLWKSFLKTKKSVEKNLNKSNEHWYQELKSSTKELTENINDSHRILSNQIRFIHFNNEYKDLPKEEYLKTLTLHGGFSKEDLLEIGIDESLIKENSKQLFSKNVMDKFLEFKNEFNKSDE